MWSHVALLNLFISSSSAELGGADQRKGNRPLLPLKSPSLQKCSILTFLCPSLAGRLRVWHVGSRGDRHRWGPADRRRPLQHQEDTQKEEEQLQAPEEEGQTARRQDHFLLHLNISLIVGRVLSVFPPQQPREPRSSGQDQAMLLADSSEDEF